MGQQPLQQLLGDPLGRRDELAHGNGVEGQVRAATASGLSEPLGAIAEEFEHGLVRKRIER